MIGGLDLGGMGLGALGVVLQGMQSQLHRIEQVGRRVD
jgi:hypothetical protein